MSNELADQALLGKIDALRALNIGSMIPLPQLVVVGDQSSGKSSVLESLTGFSFPRGAELCTRYATQITCCREEAESVQISIIPRPDADEATKERLFKFKSRVTVMSNETLARVFKKANLAMGIRMNTDEEGSNKTAFSENVLKIEIFGPNSHLTVIDVPGIFRVATPGLTTETDIVMVENMVKRYMNDSRTIILAVVPCNVDVATQEILKLAETADPEGQRTMGILTKPDLATETATKNAAINLLSGKRSILKLGYYVVKNRGADDASSSLSQRESEEHAFFTAAPWSSLRDRCGVLAVKERLRKLLLSVTRRGFAHVRHDIEQRLNRCRNDIKSMGPAREDETMEREYLGKLAIEFQTITRAALNADYAGEVFFETNPQMKLITRMMDLHDTFAKTLSTKGHEQHFASESDDEEQKASSQGQNEGNQGKVGKSDDERSSESITNSTRRHAELHDLIESEIYECPYPKNDSIMTYIMSVYKSSRGPELGTFGGRILAAIFKHQSEKWAPVTLSHISDAIILVHDFIRHLLNSLCCEEQVHTQLWEHMLTVKLRESYTRAMDHAHFLLEIERGRRPATFNHYFNDVLQKKRGERIVKLAEKFAVSLNLDEHPARDVPLNSLRDQAVNKANSEQICEDLLDAFVSYYKVALKRFIDVVYQHVISHCLLEGDGSPLKVFGPEMVMKLKAEELDLIAGEDEESKQRRMVLKREMESLEKAIKIVRS